MSCAGNSYEGAKDEKYEKGGKGRKRTKDFTFVFSLVDPFE